MHGVSRKSRHRTLIATIKLHVVRGVSPKSRHRILFVHPKSCRDGKSAERISLVFVKRVKLRAELNFAMNLHQIDSDSWRASILVVTLTSATF